MIVSGFTDEEEMILAALLHDGGGCGVTGEEAGGAVWMPAREGELVLAESEDRASPGNSARKGGVEPSGGFQPGCEDSQALGDKLSNMHTCWRARPW